MTVSEMTCNVFIGTFNPIYSYSKFGNSSIYACAVQIWLKTAHGTSAQCHSFIQCYSRYGRFT